MLRILLFVALVVMPISEIAVFLLVGSAIGVLPTIAIIILTAIIGTVLLRRQGVSALRRLQDDTKAGRVPAAAIGHAVTVAIAGVLLLTPGFITDAIGFALFLPAVRRGLWRQISGSVKVHRPGGQRPPSDADTYARRRTHARTIDLGSDDYGPADDRRR